MERYDVVLVGGGLAGLALARHLLLTPGTRRVLLLEKRASVPPPGQKVGEATVQVSAYYLSRVLGLEEHLLREHFLKYNLRFHWKTPGLDASSYETYSQSYIRQFSNIATYQLDRNALEAELLRLNVEDPSFTFRPGVSDIQARVDETPHRITFTAAGDTIDVEAGWFVDTSGRGKLLARGRGLHRAGEIRHGASFMWVEGLLNVEALTSLSPRAARVHRNRSAIGHAPIWLATNHFCGEGFWFWTIPLQGRTSLGLVFDSALIPYDSVSSVPKLVDWVCREFPIFARDLPRRKVLHHAGLRDFAFDCAQTISADRWAMAGEAGRFSDPLYSPGGDLIALYNTLIVDAIQTTDPADLARKAALYEPMMRAFYEAYVPGFAIGYSTLGDQEAFSLKYVWELTIYFGFYVFPFINDLFTDVRFAAHFLRRFTELGRVNRNIQAFISAFYHWKKSALPQPAGQIFFEFTDVGPLWRAQQAFYDVGVTVEDAMRLLDEHAANVRRLARFIVAHVSARVAGDRSVLHRRAFVEDIDLLELTFDPEAIRDRHARTAGAPTHYEWPFDAAVLDRFSTELPVRT